MLDAADILVDRQPAIDDARLGRRLRVRRGEAGEIPGRVDEGVHRVGLAPRRAAALSGRRRCARSDGGRADCRGGRTRRRRAASPADPRAAPARRRRPGSGSSGSGSPNSAGARCPSRAGGNSPAARRPGGCRASAISSRRATSSFASVDAHAVEEARIDHAAVAEIGVVGDGEGLRVLAPAGRRPASRRGRICWRSRGRAGRAPGSRRWRRCRSPSA